MMDELYRQFAIRAARHEVLMRQDVMEMPKGRDEMKKLRVKFAMAVDDISNLLNIVEALSGEKIRGK